MELRQLVTFREVAAALSFTRAAATLDYAQSSVTAQIQALEEDLGVRLFDRLGRRVTLTDAGRRLLRYAEDLLDLADEARLAVSGGEAPAGTIAIGAPETVCAYRLPAVLHLFRSRFPRVRLVFRPTPSPDLPRGVGEGALDVAFILGAPIRSRGLLVEPLVAEPLLVLAAPDHPLAQAPRVSAADLEGESILLTKTGCGYRALFARALAAEGVQPTETLEFGSVEAIKQCVIAGLGIAVLPEVAVAAEVAAGHLSALRWVGPELRAWTQMIWHREKRLSPALGAFLDVARELLAGAPEPSHESQHQRGDGARPHVA